MYTRPSGAQLLSAGPYRALVPADQQGHGGWMTLVEGRPTERDPARIIRDYGAPHLLHDVD